jgi:hypothetical protein
LGWLKKFLDFFSKALHAFPVVTTSQTNSSMKANNKSVHPTLARVRAEYPRCTAQTTAGLARYVRANKSTFPSHPIPFETPGLVQYFDGNWVGNNRTQTDKERFILRRHQNRYDLAERQNEKLRKRLYGRFSVPAKSVGGVAKRAEEYNQILSMGKHPLPIVENAVLLGCHYHDHRFLEQQGIKICRRGYNWSISASLSPSRVAHTDGETINKHMGNLSMNSLIVMKMKILFIVKMQ